MTLTDIIYQRALVAQAIDTFLDIANANCPAGYLYTAEPSGKRYRIIMDSHPGGQYGRSVHAFVDGDTGDLLKAAGWKVPAKGIRYNLLTEMDVIRANFGWAGGYLYADHKRKPVAA